MHYSLYDYQLKVIEDWERLKTLEGRIITLPRRHGKNLSFNRINMKTVKDLKGKRPAGNNLQVYFRDEEWKEWKG